MLERFWKLVGKTDGCWTWGGQTSEGGYGLISTGGREGHYVLAHRYSYELHHGPIPEKQLVRHTCDNPPCTRPDHLITGTHLDNSQDMVERGRQASGEKNGYARLTADKVVTMRALYSTTSMSQEAIAALFDITQGHLSDILARKSWGHIP